MRARVQGPSAVLESLQRERLRSARALARCAALEKDLDECAMHYEVRSRGSVCRQRLPACIGFCGAHLRRRVRREQPDRYQHTPLLACIAAWPRCGGCWRR
jgi:hypothetical protein